MAFAILTPYDTFRILTRAKPIEQGIKRHAGRARGAPRMAIGRPDRRLPGRKGGQDARKGPPRHPYTAPMPSRIGAPFPPPSTFRPLFHYHGFNLFPSSGRFLLHVFPFHGLTFGRGRCDRLGGNPI